MEVFEKNIRRRQEFAQNLAAFFVPQIDGDAFFVAVERAKARTVAFVFGIAPAVRVAAVGQFDFDHVAAEIAEQAAGVGAGHVAADVDTSITFESSGNHVRFKSLKQFTYLNQKRFSSTGFLAPSLS